MAYNYSGDVDLSVYGEPIVGVTGYGTLAITGGYEDIYSGIIGDTVTGDGVVDIYGGGYLFVGDGTLSDNRLFVGYFGAGELNITNGTVRIQGGGYSGLSAGRFAGSYGYVLVAGGNSSLEVYDTAARLSIGRAGEGHLIIRNGGYATAQSLDAGRENGAIGVVTITGAGSELSLNNYDGRTYGAASPYFGEAAFGRIGRESGSNGYLYITNGGLLELSNIDGVTDNPSFQIARNDGSYGRAVVDGLGSEFTITQYGANGDFLHTIYKPGRRPKWPRDPGGHRSGIRWCKRGQGARPCQRRIRRQRWRR